MALIIAIVLLLVIATAKFSDSSAKYVSKKKVEDRVERWRKFERTFEDYELELSILDTWHIPEGCIDEKLKAEYQKAKDEAEDPDSVPDYFTVILTNRGKIKRSCINSGVKWCNPKKYLWIQETLRKQGFDVEMIVFVGLNKAYWIGCWKDSFGCALEEDKDWYEVVPLSEFDPEKYKPKKKEIPKPYYEKED